LPLIRCRFLLRAADDSEEVVRKTAVASLAHIAMESNVPDQLQVGRCARSSFAMETISTVGQ